MMYTSTTSSRPGRAGPATAFRLLTACALALSAVVAIGPHPAHAQTSTKDFKGLNWADQRDNFVNGVLYPSGLSATDTYSSAATVADRVVGQMYSITGANTVRMPINEPTVATDWPAYTGAIDAALTKGNVILAYWAYTGGKPKSTDAFYQMWDTVVARYAGNPHAYFEVINEPYGYSTSGLQSMYDTWLTRYPQVPRSRVILDGAGYATNLAAVGTDSDLDGTLIAVHYYSFFPSSPYEDETQWSEGLASLVGPYAGRTISTEWGGPMGPGVKNGVHYNAFDYDIPSGSFFADYIRGVSSELRTLGIGSVYWPGLRDGDWYSLTTKTGSGPDINLSLANASGLSRLRYAWHIGNGGTTHTSITNASTGQYVDGLSAAAPGSDAGQSAFVSGLASQRWAIQNDGDYVRIKNLDTGLYLDGLGSTANGSAAGQQSGTDSVNQQWTVITDGDNVLIKNRGTGLYLDGMGRTGNGADLAQYSYSNSLTQQWKIVPVG